ncbi:MAG: hypothetical protein GW886_04880 [Rhodobacterales bacterium]|nr:hypothetical protein [Rhodobacterales bacterium]NCT11437.1 hypothetical protein [Rhodobacterales bacterium]
MAVSTDILRTWRAPRAVMRDLLAMGPREDRAIAYLMVACLLVFIAQWPRLARVAHEQQIPLDREIAYELFGWLFVWPLIFYAIAGLSYLVLRLLFGGATPFGARLALFWSFLAASPMALLYGLLNGVNGASSASQLVGLVWLLAFGAFWVQSLREVRALAGAGT